MVFEVQICVINPDTFQAKRKLCQINIDKPGPDYRDIVLEFFKNWEQQDKYEKCYAIGVESMKAYDN